MPYVERLSNPDYDVDTFVGVDYFREDLVHADTQATQIPVTDIAGQVLVIAGTDDQLWPSVQMAKTIERQFTENFQPSKVKALYFKGAGHVIAPGAPTNLTEVRSPNGTTIVLGGEPQANARAQQQSLDAMVSLFKNPVCRTQSHEHHFDKAKLTELREFVHQAGSSSMVLIEQGEIAFEFGDIHRKHTIHSIRKAMLNSLYGIYVARGVIDLDATVGALGIDDVHGLSEREKTATVRQLLKARSGVYHPSAATHQLILDGMPERYSRSPGEVYVYNNWDFNVAGVGIHMLAVYPASDLVFVHRVATEQDTPFDQQNLYRIIGKFWQARR